MRIYKHILSVFTFLASFGAESAKAIAQTKPTTLVNLPGPIKNPDSINDYLNALFILLISVSIIVAVVKISISGFLYMTAGDNAGRKETAKSQIRVSLLGLALILATVIILNTIFPGIVSFSALNL